MADTHSKRPVALVWLRQDLRLEDQPALAAAIEDGLAVVPVFIWSSAEEGEWAPGGAARWWLHEALTDLAAQLADWGGQLVLRQAPAAGPELLRLAAETGARAVYWCRRYEPAAIARDSAVKTLLKAAGLKAESCNGSLLFEPHTVATGGGLPYQVYTPFSRNLAARPAPPPVVVDWPHVAWPTAWPASVPLAELRLLPRPPTPPWHRRLAEHWQPTGAAAQARLRRFVAGAAADYHDERNRPDHDGTSRLSPYLHWGQLGPRQVAHALAQSPAAHRPGGEVFLKEIWWREFAYHILFHFPHLPTQPLRPAFARFPWRDDAALLAAWERGRTGYPIVDAGMRQLYATGWMHNRVRMIVASFLVKHLLQPWQAGARWFWDTLVDADLAANTLGWQWSAGCGPDAAPYFRIFNPVSQAEKFDPAGAYIRQWVPEVAKLQGDFLYAPWTAPLGVRRALGYPEPLVDHATARALALVSFAKLKEPGPAPETAEVP